MLPRAGPRCYGPTMISISPDQVRAEISKFWEIMCGTSDARLEDLYSSAALLFTGKAKKPEPTEVALARRSRQIAQPQAQSQVKLGFVEVEILGPGVALASYT